MKPVLFVVSQAQAMCWWQKPIDTAKKKEFCMANPDLLTNFTTYLLTEKRVSHNTFLAYQQDLKQLEKFLHDINKTWNDATKTDIVSFLKQCKQEGSGAKTVSRKISTYKLLWGFLEERYHVTNVTKTVTFPKTDKTLPKYLSEVEVQQLLRETNNDTTNKGVRNKVMLYLLYATGLRVTELVELTIDAILFDAGFIKVHGKGNKERMVPVPKNILELLRYYLDHVYKKITKIGVLPQSKQYLFAVTYKNALKPLSRQSLWGALKKVLQKSGINPDISPHSLRHSLATHLLNNGADLRSLQMLLGHQNLATLQVYTHIGKKELRIVYDKKHPRA
jgi:integrase/recombinase XerD